MRSSSNRHFVVEHHAEHIKAHNCNCSSSASSTDTFPQLLFDLVLFLLVILASSLTGYRLVLNRPLEINKRPRTRRDLSFHHERSYEKVPPSRINKLREKAKRQYVTATTTTATAGARASQTKTTISIASSDT